MKSTIGLTRKDIIHALVLTAGMALQTQPSFAMDQLEICTVETPAQNNPRIEVVDSAGQPITVLDFGAIDGGLGDAVDGVFEADDVLAVVDGKGVQIGDARFDTFRRQGRATAAAGRQGDQVANGCPQVDFAATQVHGIQIQSGRGGGVHVLLQVEDDELRRQRLAAQPRRAVVGGIESADRRRRATLPDCA